MEGAKEESTLKKPKRGEEISLRAGSFGGGGGGEKSWEKKEEEISFQACVGGRSLTFNFGRR